MIRPFPTRDRIDQRTLTEKKHVITAVESLGTEAGGENVEPDTVIELFSNSVSFSNKSAKLSFMMILFFLEGKETICGLLDGVVCSGPLEHQY